MDKKKMIEMAISMLQEVEPETIEVVNFDRTEYDDGSVGFSVNLTTPPEKKDYIGPQGIYLGGCTIAKYADPANCIEIEKAEDIEADKLHFTHNQRYFVLDLGEPDLEEKAITLHCGYKKAYMTDHVQTEYINLTHGVRGTEES
ncbi:hypothetical protein [Planococcus dechangensis]|uniref:Uncharacterized protein n=1 Tax=Planococcus dechangensis TaxID=1176255 RepID=A0ABV9MB44_9BACL